MDPDFQLIVHFNAGEVQRVQKRFLNQSVLTKAKLMTTVPGKSKLTVSTRNSILDPRCFRKSRIEF